MRILGVRIDDVNMNQTLELLLQRLALPRHERGFAQVVTLNPEGVMLAREDAALRRATEEATLVTPDGNGMLWAAEKLGRPLTERVTGVDLIDKLAEVAAGRGYRFYLLGAKPGVAEQAAQELQKRWPGLVIAGTENGYFRDREEAVLAEIEAAQPDILLAGLGMPFQEIWLYEHRHRFSGTVCIGVGGSFDVISGQVKRAPQLWQKLKLEWLWRLLSDPKRWRRYLAIPRFMRAVKKEARERA